MNDYKVTLSLNSRDYEQWKEFLKYKKLVLTGKNGTLQSINSKVFTRTINQIMCKDQGCKNCEQCDYDFELKEIDILE